MSLHDLKDRYGGRNVKTRDAINRAIAAELVGGDDLLAALPLVDRLTQRLRDHGVAGVSTAQRALDALVELRELMVGLIAARHKLRMGTAPPAPSGPADASDLTLPQHECLEWIAASMRREQRPPSMREVARGLGHKSLHAVVGLVEALRRKGYLDPARDGEARSLTLRVDYCPYCGRRRRHA